ncbi:DUF4113 domain-containing protein [Methylobacterium sp. E-045]|uniref:DUF4113 domain-containing protein n=1 Tax=Methylobacterium sp. E-045 TaxID=2836575 RepID=UPI0028BEAFAB|nr:DUF4113 domain-containing protein [Methylobacterium sp. E-045]
MDRCIRRFGRGAVVPARVGLEKKRTWSTKFEMRSPRYTTQVSELPTALVLS